MPKRNCPFAESNRPQVKNHIGVKEVNLGVMSHEKMKAVYERTLGMMYAASRTASSDTLHQTSANNNEELSIKPVTVTPPHAYAAPLPGQRKLNFNGQLEGVYTREQCTVPRESQHQMFIPIACSTCSNAPSTPRLCQYCERCLCEYCFRECKSCCQTFCTDCSTVRYDATDETWVCYNCV